MRVYFFSDVHLGHYKDGRDIKIESVFLEFLKKLKSDCTHLIIVGDLFDYWFEYKTVIPKHYIRTIAELYNLKQAGIGIEYLMGNHDFGHRNFFEKELGIPIYRDDITREFNGKKFYISHGDGKAHNDTGYLILKKILRNKIAQRLFQSIHPDLGIKIASSSSRKSRGYTASKSYGRRDGLQDFAENKINDGFDYVIMGHSHRAVEETFGNGKYINLGEWELEPMYAVFDGEALKLKFVKEFLK